MWSGGAGAYGYGGSSAYVGEIGGWVVGLFGICVIVVVPLFTYVTWGGTCPVKDTCCHESAEDISDEEVGMTKV